MSPTKYKLSYFNVTGLAEPIRYLLHFGNIEFEDYRYEKDEWAQVKPSTPFGKCPVLDIDGKKVHQSVAICRHLARQIGNLCGGNDWENFEVDIIVDTITDFRLNYASYFKEENAEAKAKKLEEIKTVQNKFYLRKFEDIVQKNNGHLIGKQLTWADIFFTAITELMSNILKENILSGYTNLEQLAREVENLPGIKEYREKRPVTFL